MAKTENCGSCRCWSARPAPVPMGLCRRRAPTVDSSLLMEGLSYRGGRNLDAASGQFQQAITQATLTASVFPATLGSDWCAEFQWKPGDEPITGC